MTPFPQSNARLTQVAREGFTEDYDRPEGTQDPVWLGNIDAYIQRKYVSGFNDKGELNRSLMITLYIAGDLPVRLQEGDTVTYIVGDPNSPTPMQGRIQGFINPAELASMPDYYKCTMEEIGAV